MSVGAHDDINDGQPEGQDDYQLHDNRLRDYVNYCRSGTIRNEQQFSLLMLSYASGLQSDPHGFISSVLIGTSSAGKSHIKQEAEELLEKLTVYSSDSGSDKSTIYSDKWDISDVASMGELQQPPEELIEFLKRVHGGDEEFEYSVTKGSVRDGFEEETFVKKALPYVFTYAQFDPDFEMWNRLLKISAHESESKNRAVMRMAFGQDSISIDSNVSYGYDFEAGTQELIDHIGRVKTEAPDLWAMPAETPGEDVPIVDILEPMFNHSRSESNRIYWMVANLVGASALVNYQNRDIVAQRYDGRDVGAVAVAPQDVANIIRMRPALLATTHELDDRKRAVLQAIRDKGGKYSEVDGLNPIREWLSNSDAPEVKQTELRNILRDLEANFLVDINEGGGDQGDLFRAYQLDQLGTPNVDEHAEYFEDCTDPLTGRPFMEVWPEQRDRSLTDAQELLAGGDVSSDDERRTVDTGGSDDTSNDGGLSQFSSTDNSGVELTQTEQALSDECLENIDGVRIPDLRDVSIEAFLGLVDPQDPDMSGISTDGTLLDPENDLWDRSDRGDTWVDLKKDARRELTGAIESLVSKEVITFETIHERIDGKVVDADITVDIP